MRDGFRVKTLGESILSDKRRYFEGVKALEVHKWGEWVVRKPCGLCGARDARLAYMQAHFPVVRCRRCGLMYADEHFSESDLTGFYLGNYYQHAYVCQPKKIDQSLARDYARIFERVASRRLGGKLLDFGCARGTFLGKLLACGYGDRWDLLGIDINPDEVQMGRDAGRPVMCCDLFTARFPESEFDVVTAFSVIEHMQHPMSTLRELSRVLKPGGELIVIVPSGECLIIKGALLAARLSAKAFRGFTDNVFHEEHLYYFTRRTFAEMCMQVGLEPRVIHGAPSYLETHPPSPLIAAGAYTLRLASFVLRHQTMLVAIARKT